MTAETISSDGLPDPRRGRRSRDRKSGRILAIAGSILLHGAAFGYLALSRVPPLNGGPFAVERALDAAPVVTMEPRPDFRDVPIRTPKPVAARAAPRTPPDRRALARPERDRPAPVILHLAPPAPPSTLAPPADANPWTVTPDSNRAAIARSLRLSAAGCRTLTDQLTAAEQAVCEARFAAAAASRGSAGARTLSASEQRREGQFAAEGAANLARYERRAAPLTGAIGVAGISPECVGGNLRGTCAGANLPSRYSHPEENPYGGKSGPK